MLRGIGCFVCIVFMVSCTHQTRQQRMAAFINNPENKIVQSIQLGEVRATAKWLPDHFQNGSTDNTPLNSKERIEDYCYFNVKIEKSSIEKPAREKIMYLNFDMQNDFVVLCGGDSISPVICQKVETGIPGRFEYLVAFRNSNSQLSKNDFTLYYKDKIFGLGVIAFVYSQKDIRKIPKV